MKMDKRLEKAVLLGDLPLIISLIQDGCAVDGIDKYGRTVMYDAITKGFKGVVLELCLAKANVNNQDNNGKTPLHFASIHNQIEIAETLIKYNANVNLKDDNGNTPIFDAVFNSKGNPNIILLLKENNADYITPNNYGVSAKELAETISNYDLAHLFN